LPQPTTTLAFKIMTALEASPAPLTLLLVAIFYLWAYARKNSGVASETGPATPRGGA